MFLYICIAVFTYAVYANLIKPTLYWRKRNIFYVQPWKSLARVFLSSKSLFEGVIAAYNEYPDRSVAEYPIKYVGSYQFLKPSLFVRDLELIKRITVKDFDHFPDHLGFVDEETDPLVGLNLFALKGDRWRDMRSTLSPAFTSAKMRSMYTLIQETAENFAEHFFMDDNEVVELEMKNVFTRFTNDVIANCAFGIKCDSLKDEKNEFYTMGSTLTNTNGTQIWRGILATFCPNVFKFFRLSVFSPSVTQFFHNLIMETISFREKENIVRPDMIHLLMEARKGRLRHEIEKPSENDTGFATVEESSLGKSISKMELTDDVITAQALIFFFAGFETTSTLLSFLSYELALNPDAQIKLQEEVDRATKDGTETLSYEELLKMKYLDQVISETLRKYPPGFVLNRVCVKDYKIKAIQDNEVDLVVEKGCLITVPVVGIHRDPKYFPKPDTFDPDRFSDENKAKIVPGSYLPFGSGPRNCIGSRFALLEAKALTASLMSRFDIVPVKRTAIPIKLSKTLNLSVRDGFWLGFKKRKACEFCEGLTKSDAV